MTDSTFGLAQWAARIKEADREDAIRFVAELRQHARDEAIDEVLMRIRDHIEADDLQSGYNDSKLWARSVINELAELHDEVEAMLGGNDD